MNTAWKLIPVAVLLGCSLALAGCGPDEAGATAGAQEGKGELKSESVAKESAKDPQLDDEGFPITRFKSSPWIYTFEDPGLQERGEYANWNGLYDTFYTYHLLRPWKEDPVSVLDSATTHGGDVLADQGLNTGVLVRAASKNVLQADEDKAIKNIENALSKVFEGREAPKLVTVTIDQGLHNMYAYDEGQGGFQVHQHLLPEEATSKLSMSSSYGALGFSLVNADGMKIIKVSDSEAIAAINDAVSRGELDMVAYGFVHSLYRGKVSGRPSSDRRVQVQPHFIDLVDSASGTVLHTIEF